MTREDIIRMAREAGAERNSDFPDWSFDDDQLERFAALVVKPWAKQLEVERKRFQELNDVVAVGMQHARADEREACAKVCEEAAALFGDSGHIGVCLTNAGAIRARGNT